MPRTEQPTATTLTTVDVLDFAIVAALLILAFMLPATDRLALSAAVFFLMNLKPWTPPHA